MKDGIPHGKNKYLLMPDSFKDTMDAAEVCGIMKSAIHGCDPDAEIISMPVADGGEGTVDCFLTALGGEKRETEVTGPYGETVRSFYGAVKDTAVIEMAAAAGFSHIRDGMADPSAATTYGVGELIRDAIEKGARKIILGLGGSCTNDCGAGMAAALGTRFFDAAGKEFVPVGRTLGRVCRIDGADAEGLLDGISVEAMCDIDNPLYGADGAAYVFAPQKGADERMVRMLDRNLRIFADTIDREMGVDVSGLPGGGAAGGMGAGAYVFLKAGLRQGIDVVLDALRFDAAVEGCRAVFTGEGQFDSQSLGGKAVVGISGRAMKVGIPVIAVVGRIKDNGDMPDLSSLGITQIIQAAERPYSSREEMLRCCRRDLYDAVARAMESGLI